MKRMSNLDNWATARRYGLTVLLTLGLLALFLFLLADPPTLAQSTRTVNQAAIEVNQTVGTEVGICAPNSVIAATARTTVHYCVTIRNTGPTRLLTHTLSYAGINNTIPYTLESGSALNVTTNILNLSEDRTFLAYSIPDNATGTITHTVQVTSIDEQGRQATGQATAIVVIGTVGLRVSKTVGLTSICPTTKGIAVNPNTVVKYCVTVQNTGTLALTKHQLIDPLLNVNASFTGTIPAGVSLVITEGALLNQPLEALINGNLTNTLTFNSATAQGVSVSAQDQAVVVIGQARIAVTDTLGLDVATCGTSSSIAVVAGRSVYHCLRIKNEGTIPLETHEIRSTVFVTNPVITQTLPPGESLVIPNLAHTRAVTTTSNFTVTSRSSEGIVAVDTAQSRIAVGTQTFTMAKYATADPNGCRTVAPLSVASNQAFYYCLVLTNTGTVPLVRYTFTEGAPLNLSGAFTYTLAQNQSVTVTNQFLVNTLKLPPSLGPFTASASLPGSLTLTAFSAENMSMPLVASFQVNISAPVPTATPSSTPFPTFTPTISPTPSLTPFIPPTPTATPIALSFAAPPTQPFDINSVTTPTPIIGAGGVPPALDPFGQPISPLDPAQQVNMQSTVFALTVEAAATQTAWAFSQQPVFDTPIPPTAAPLIESPLESPLPTATLFEVTPTPTSVALLSPLATPPLLDNYVNVFAQVFQVSTATLSWLWFLGGSIVFFATAGMFFGLSWLRRRTAKGSAYAGAQDGNMDAGWPDNLSPPARATQPANLQSSNQPDDDDPWPASLR